MQRCTWLMSALTVLSMSAAAVAQDGKDAKGAPEMTEEMKARMAAMEKMCTVGDNHKVLDYMVGEWTTTCKMRWDEKDPWMESTGTCSAKWILDGRFVQATQTGTMMGQPHTGVVTIGYDTVKGKYVSTWMDNACTGICMSEGTYDPSSKSFTYTTEMDCPMTPGEKLKVREVITIKDKDTHTFEWFELQKGKEVKTMEITYKRTGAA